MNLKQKYLDIARFFEQGDLVPFAVLTSAWHFIQALIKHGEAIPVAIATGIFVDMLHFRTVRKAVDERNRRAWLVALLTTAISYAFHLLFYVAHLAPDGSVIYDWSFIAFFMALPLPVGIPILAWQQATKSDPVIVKRWRKRVKAVIRIARRDRNRVQEAEIQLKRIESRLQALETTVAERERNIQQLKSQLQAAQDAERIMKHFNPLVQDIGLMMAGAEMTQAEIAAKHGTNETAVSRLKSQLNGASQ